MCELNIIYDRDIQESLINKHLGLLKKKSINLISDKIYSNGKRSFKISSPKDGKMNAYKDLVINLKFNDEKVLEGENVSCVKFIEGETILTSLINSHLLHEKIYAYYIKNGIMYEEVLFKGSMKTQNFLSVYKSHTYTCVSVDKVKDEAFSRFRKLLSHKIKKSKELLETKERQLKDSKEYIKTLIDISKEI